MALINNSGLEQTLQSDIDALSTASLSSCLLIPGLKNCINIQNNVVDLANLPNICTHGIPNGQLVFVHTPEAVAPVVASNCEWIGMDGRVLRYDRPASKLYAWGSNSYGRLGDNTSTGPRTSPVSVVGGFTDWCQVSAGRKHTAAVRTNGTLWTWGRNTYGQLGDNTTVSKSSPVSVAGGFTDWCQVSAGGGHTAAVRTNGTLWTWGSNGFGQLGNNTTTQLGPVSVVGGFTDWCQVSAGYLHTAAIRTNGTLWTWGSNGSGQLGHNTATTCFRTSPASVVGGFTDWCQVSAGGGHTAAIRTNGTLWTWGCNSSGRLGDNTATDRSSPVSVVGGFTDWCQVSAGGDHTAAMRTNGTLWAWGGNNVGQLGDNSIIARASPVSVAGGFTDWCQVSAGVGHTTAVRTNGTLWTWGSNGSGQLGNNTTTNRSSPVSVVGGFTDWCQVSAGYQNTFGIITS